MTFQEPLGLLVFAFIPLFLLVLNKLLKKRSLTVASFHILSEIVDSLPPLPPSFLWRKRLQKVLLVTAVFFLALAAGGMVLGSPESRPVTAVVLVDRLSHWEGPEGSPSGWEELVDKAAEICRRFRRGDRIVLLRSDGSEGPEGPVSPGSAIRKLRRTTPAERAIDPVRTADRLDLIHKIYQPDHTFIVTPFPSRWEGLDRERDFRATVVPSAPPPQERNRALLDVEIRPRLLRPKVVDLYCRVGVFAAGGENAAEEVTLRGQVDGETFFSETFSLRPGDTRGLTLEGISLKAGVVTIMVEPLDYFPADNIFRTPVRDKPFLTAGLLTPGNTPLRAALEALPGLTLVDPAANPAPDVLVVDGLEVPEEYGGNLLLLRPPGNLPFLGIQGAVSRPGPTTPESSHPVLEEVSFEGLHLDRLPVFAPSPSLEVLARADGYPVVMAGRGDSGARVGVIAFDPLSSGWTQSPSFPILVANLASWIGADAGGHRTSFLAGDRIPSALQQRSLHLTEPRDRPGRLSRGEVAPFRFDLSGRYRVGPTADAAGGELFVNLLDETVSSAMVSGDGGGAAPPWETLPFRWEAGRDALLLALVLLLLETAITPAARVGRFDE